MTTFCILLFGREHAQFSSQFQVMVHFLEEVPAEVTAGRIITTLTNRKK